MRRALYVVKFAFEDANLTTIKIIVVKYPKFFQLIYLLKDL
jgi:hypothetical protein